MKNMNNRIDWKTVFKLGGAYAAFHIGAGFASGQETMQYFGSFGSPWCFLIPAFIFVWTICYCISNYRTGATVHFDNPNDVFVYYNGPVLGRILDIVVNVCLALTSLVMFAGAGATVHQYAGLPTWVGSLLMGLVAGVVVLLGLEKMTNVLGGCGVIIIAVMAVVGVYGFITSDVSIVEGGKNIQQYVNDGIFLQATAFGTHNPILTSISFGGLGLALIMTYTTAMGKQCKNMKTCVASAVASAFFYVLGIILVCWTMLEHLDYIAELKAKVPMLAAVSEILPWMSLPYCIITLVGVFTTIAGYLWICGRRVGPDGTWRMRIAVIVVDIVGITVGAMIPLDKLVNFLFSLSGYAGIVMFATCVIGDIIRWRKGKLKAFPAETSEPAVKAVKEA